MMVPACARPYRNPAMVPALPRCSRCPGGADAGACAAVHLTSICAATSRIAAGGCCIRCGGCFIGGTGGWRSLGSAAVVRVHRCFQLRAEAQHQLVLQRVSAGQTGSLM